MSKAIALLSEAAKAGTFLFLYSYLHILDKMTHTSSAVVHLHSDVRTSSVLKTLKIAAQICNKSYLVLRLNKQNTQEYFFLTCLLLRIESLTHVPCMLGGGNFNVSTSCNSLDFDSKCGKTAIN